MLAGQLELQMYANMARLAQDMNEAKRTVNSAMSNIEKSVAQAKAALGALGIGLSAGMFVAMIKGSIDAADAMNDLSQKVGIGIKDLATWKLAAAQSGTSLESVAKGVKGLSGYMIDHADKLKAAGISARDANGAMVQLADLFKAMPDGVEKTALAVQLFGKAGMDMIPMLNQGSQGLAEAQEKAAAYGRTLAALAPDADKFNDLLAELKMQSEITGLSFATKLIGPLTDAAEFFKAARGGAEGLAEALERIERITGNENNPLSVFKPLAWMARKAGEGSQNPNNTPLPGYDPKTGRWNTPLGDVEAFDRAAEAYMAEREAKRKAMGLLDKKDAAGGGNNALERMLEVGRRNLAGSIDSEEEQRIANTKRDMQDARQEFEALQRILKTGEQNELAAYYETAGEETMRLVAAQRELKSAEEEQRRQLEAAAAMKRLQEQQRRDWERFTDDIDRALTDALMRGFENGKDGGKAFVDSIKNSLKTAAFKIAVQAVVSPVMGAVGSVMGVPGAGSGVGGVNPMSIASGANALASMTLTPFANAGASFAYSSAGQAMGLSSAAWEGSSIKVLTESGQVLQGATEFLDSYGGYINAAYQLSQGNYGAAAGAAIGSYFGGPIGSVIGSTIGGALFDGGGEDPHNNGQVRGFEIGLNRSGAFGVMNADATYVPSMISAGPTSGDGWWADSASLSAAQIAAINQQVVATFAQGAAMAKMLGVDPSVIDSASVSSLFNGNPGNGKIGGYFESLDQAFAALAESIAVKVIPNLSEFQQTGESLAVTASRLSQEFALTNKIAAMMNRDPSDLFGGSNLSARDQLVQMLGGVSGATTVLGSYYQNFHSDRERSADGRSSIEATLRAIGIADVPATREQFRALVESQNLATESGRAMYATLLSVSEAFAGITASAEEAAKALGTDRFRTRADYLFAQRTGMLPAYADGGDHAGGWAMVGEQGRELAHMGPARVYSNRDSKALLDLSPVTQAIDELRADMRAAQAVIARASNKTAKILDQWDGDGLPVERVL